MTDWHDEVLLVEALVDFGSDDSHLKQTRRFVREERVNEESEQKRMMSSERKMRTYFRVHRTDLLDTFR
jgi:hypothetical protein